MGLASLEFVDDAHALLSYNVNNAKVVKQITRLTFAPQTLVGTYIGGTTDITFDCKDPLRNGLVTTDPGQFTISQEGGDSAAVIFDAIQSARAKGIDVVLADTAGRLPTQLHLMDEIRKVKRVMAKADALAPHETWLVIDANTGQNAVRQVKAFDEALGLTGLVVTKLDGTAKGGAVAAIAREHPVPIRFIGIGEKAEDLRPFSATDFVDALFE